MYDKLFEAADAAARELRRNPLPPPSERKATERLAKVVGDILHHGGLDGFGEDLWRSVLEKLGEQIKCPFDVFMWVGGFVRNLSELSVVPNFRPDEGPFSGVSNVHESEHIRMVLRIIDAIVPLKY